MGDAGRSNSRMCRASSIGWMPRSKWRDWAPSAWTWPTEGCSTRSSTRRSWDSAWMPRRRASLLSPASRSDWPLASNWTSSTPKTRGIRGVSIVQLARPFEGVGKVTRNTCIVAPGSSDRSPTGTGTCARMAVLHARGQMAVGDSMIHESLIGSQFHGRIVSTTSVGGRPAIIPAIRGRAWITGHQHVSARPGRPVPRGLSPPR